MSEDDEKTVQPDRHGLHLVGGDSDHRDPAQPDPDLASLVESLSVEQLRLLNEMVCVRLNYLQTLEDSRAMSRFTPGDQVTFTDKHGVFQAGTVIKLNRKTVSVLHQDGRKWNVSPTFLEPVVPDASEFSVGGSEQLSEQNIWHWTASRLPFPGTVEFDNAPVVPEMMVWLDGERFIRLLEILEPHSESEQIVKSFETVIEHPAQGDPGQPEIVRTDRKDIIHLLAPLYPGVKFVHGEVPEIQEMVGDMAEAFNNAADQKIPLNDSPDSAPLKEAVVAFYDATAELYQCAPWKHIATDTQLIGITIESLKIKDQVISVIGQSQQYFGFLLHSSVEAFDRYLQLVGDKDPSRLLDIPPHCALNFVPAKEISPALRKQTMEQGWKVANTNAHPDIFIVAGNGVSRSPRRQDFETFSVICRTLVELFKKNPKINNCWKSEKQLSWSTSVDSTQGPMKVTCTLPALPSGKTFESLNLFEQLSLLDKTDFDDAETRHQKLVDAISKTYLTSPEARSVSEPGAGHTLLMDLAYHHHGYTIALLTPGGLEHILYDIFPQKVMMEATEADIVIEDCRAYLQFLKRAYHFGGADDLLPSLNKKSVQRMQHALSDTSKFGMGKSIISGKGTHFPELTIDSDTDFDRLKQQMQQRLDSGQIDLSFPPMDDTFLENLPKPIQALSKEEKKKRKQKRKKSRKSRQKNR